MERSIETKVIQPEETRSAGHDLLMLAAGAGVTNVVGPVVHQVTEHLLNRPPKEQPPEVVLPPGVGRDE